MNTILVAVDFSPVSDNAAAYAVDLAAAINAEVELVHISYMPMSYSDVPVPVKVIGLNKGDVVRQMNDLKDKLSFRVHDRVKITSEIRSGDLLIELDALCDEVHPYAVVMGAESAGGFERLVFGGKTISAVRTLPCPLIIVPPGARFNSIHRVGLACDLKNVSETVPYKSIAFLVNEFNAALYVLHVGTEHDFAFSDEMASESGWLHDILRDLNPKYEYVPGADVESSITTFVERCRIDLLIIVPKRHGLFGRIFGHSHSKEVVLQTHVPVMSIHE
jgi:nucleotide-binding universal stress UspA family protein